MTPPAHLLLGSEQHGVTRYAGQVAGAVGAEVVRSTRWCDAVVPPDVARLHVHLTDGLLPGDPATALRWWEELTARVPTTLTLHDVPQATDGTARLERRSAVYLRLAAAARGVVCNSAHERSALAALGSSVDVGVVPLPVVERALPAATGVDRPVVGLLGFVYPGKGHAEALRAVAEVDRRRGGQTGVVALGAVAEGHAADVEALHVLARELGVRFDVTGHLDDDELDRLAAQVAVPVAAHRNVSASGSVNSWLAVRRRPLVLAGAYAREVAALRPGTTTLFEDGLLADAVDAALDDPRSTRLDGTTSTAPHLPDVALAYSSWWDTEVSW
ncbi:MAG: hypothetical protein Q7T56_03135 [Nocardioidaceae bacterium]|nr:hypothetical protein [Nocardioidaceae bacterium]